MLDELLRYSLMHVDGRLTGYASYSPPYITRMHEEVGHRNAAGRRSFWRSRWSPESRRVDASAPSVFLPAHEDPDHASGSRAAVEPDESCLRTDARMDDAGARHGANEGTEENRMPLDPRPIPRWRRLTPREQGGSH